LLATAADSSVIQTVIPDDYVLVGFAATAAAMAVGKGKAKTIFDWLKVGKISNA
jgi:hypothetical protein